MGGQEHCCEDVRRRCGKTSINLHAVRVGEGCLRKKTNGESAVGGLERDLQVVETECSLAPGREALVRRFLCAEDQLWPISGVGWRDLATPLPLLRRANQLDHLWAERVRPLDIDANPPDYPRAGTAAPTNPSQCVIPAQAQLFVRQQRRRVCVPCCRHGVHALGKQRTDHFDDFEVGVPTCRRFDGDSAKAK